MGAVLLWALNLSVTKYILTHGFEPLPYAAVRYGARAALFVALTLSRERTLARSRGGVLPLPRPRRRRAAAEPALLRLRARL